MGVSPDHFSAVPARPDHRVGTAEPPGPVTVVVERGSDEHFQSFYRSEVDGVYRGLALAVGNPDLAQEAVHEGMARAYQRWHRISHYDCPAGWVYRVGLNWARSRLRKLNREVPSAEWWDRANAPTDGLDPDLRDALSRLSVNARAVVVLRYLLEWPTRDTAVALGVSEGTVKSRLARALGQLEEALTDEPPPGGRR